MDASLRTVQRLLGQWAPHVRVTDRDGPTLETLPAGVESPRVARVPLVEDATLRARLVRGEPQVAFGGFLDGAQASRVLMYHEGVPVVYGVAAAVIRARRGRRLVTWRRGVLRHRGVYAPRALVPHLWGLMADHAVEMIDTTGQAQADGVGVPEEGTHPAVWLDRARRAIEARREELERQLALAWGDSEQSPLYVDGGIGGSERMAAATTHVGVVQRHHTLYGGADAVPLLAALRSAERTSVFRPTPGRRAPVLSWYLRLRDASGQEPTWGLVRIEIADRGRDGLTQYADEVSRWVLAERSPLSLPDGHWHALAYGVRDCKETLRAVIAST